MSAYLGTTIHVSMIAYLSAGLRNQRNNRPEDIPFNKGRVSAGVYEGED